VRVEATDADGGLNGLVRYRIDRTRCDATGQFEVDTSTGVVYTRQPLDYEDTRHHELVVVAEDQGHPSLRASAVISVQVLLVTVVIMLVAELDMDWINPWIGLGCMTDTRFHYITSILTD